MRLSRWDAAVTLIVAAIAVPYIGYLVRGSMPFVQDPRGMSGVGLIGLILGFAVWSYAGRKAFGSKAQAGVTSVLALGAFGLGVAALWAETSDVLLAVFMASIALVWLVELGFHVVRGRHLHMA
jgi:hypothetical protein